MPHIDLDFKEKRCNISIAFLCSILLIVLAFFIYSNIRTTQQLNTLQIEARYLIESKIIPRGLIRKDNVELGIVSVNKKNYIVKPIDTLFINNVPLYLELTDTTFIVRSKHFKRSMKW